MKFAGCVGIKVTVTTPFYAIRDMNIKCEIHCKYFPFIFFKTIPSILISFANLKEYALDVLKNKQVARSTMINWTGAENFYFVIFRIHTELLPLR